MHAPLYIICSHGLFIFFKGENWAMIVFFVCFAEISSGILFLLQLAMMLWCYLMVVFTDPGSVPENWRRAAEEDGMDVNNSTAISNYFATDNVNRPLSVSEEQGHTPRYCSRCQNGKPPRCHHCSVCKSAVLMVSVYI
jgi:hypothetical protein